ncbi:kinase-like domain-containing protein [Mycena floridula]|nr:kinase-like domain-containing protein [Mycena floridula]
MNTLSPHQWTNLGVGKEVTGNTYAIVSQGSGQINRRIVVDTSEKQKLVKRESLILDRIHRASVPNFLHYTHRPSLTCLGDRSMTVKIPYGWTTLKSQQGKCWKFPDAKKMLEQLLTTIKELHLADAPHCDINAETVLVSQEGNLQLIQDLSLPYGVERRNIPLMPSAFHPPEVLLAQPLRYPATVEAIDMWSAGCIFVQLLTGKPLFAEETVDHLLISIFGFIGAPSQAQFIHAYGDKWATFKRLEQHLSTRYVDDINANITEQYALDLLKRLLNFHPRCRPTAQEAIALLEGRMVDWRTHQRQILFETLMIPSFAPTLDEDSGDSGDEITLYLPDFAGNVDVRFTSSSSPSDSHKGHKKDDKDSKKRKDPKDKGDKKKTKKKDDHKDLKKNATGSDDEYDATFMIDHFMRAHP